MNFWFFPFGRFIRILGKDPGARFIVTLVFILIMFLGICIFVFMKK